MISERGGGVEEEEYTPKSKEVGRERERDRNMEREKEKDKNQPNRAKRISVATTSFSGPTAASSSSNASAYMPFTSAPAEDLRYHVSTYELFVEDVNILRLASEYAKIRRKRCQRLMPPFIIFCCFFDPSAYCRDVEGYLQ